MIRYEMMQKNINPYNQEIFESEFKKTELYNQLLKEYNDITFAHHQPIYFNSIQRTQTPRQYCSKSLFSAVPFYYINYLTQQNPEEIYDLGCGYNIFKKYIPNIIGIGAENPASDHFYADIHDYVDDDFIKGHQNYYESVFSINALHYIPLTHLRQVVVDFMSMIKPNGMGFLALNLQRMIDRDETFKNSSEEELEIYIREQLYNVPAEYKVFDVNLESLDNYMDGNIRLVCHKTI